MLSGLGNAPEKLKVGAGDTANVMLQARRCLKFRLPDILEALAAPGRACRVDDGRWLG